MGSVFLVVNKFSDVIAWPFGRTPAIFDLALLSLTCAFCMLNIFKRFSNQEKIKRVRSKIFGYFLEIGIYRDQFARVLSSQGNILKHTLIYLRYMWPPFLMMLIPVLMVCMLIEGRLGYLPIQVDKSFIVHAALDSKTAPSTASLVSQVRCETSAGILLETPPLRLAADGDVYWRARLTKAGPQHIAVTIGGSEEVVRKKIATDGKQARFSPLKTKENTWNYVLQPAETPIPPDSHFKSVSVDYVPAAYPLLGWDISPVIYFFILTMVFGFILKPFMKVNI
ncbi:hypothetical protein JY97_13840 [Alkalispirochaeta odontotermitis]|nr:hypothetical protein JY97_13840 [Alkalispirochaeta odontotermitis]CAB1078992.1 hypothetical protein D1AOALGA4SA_6710 [Olavius algarvensis Delta 1 endosymbiont]